MQLIYDLIYTNLEVFKKTNRLLASHHLLMYVGLIYVPLLWAASMLAASLPFFGGMVWFLALAAVFSNYFHLIDLATKGYKTDWQDVRDGFRVFTRKIFNILFILWVIDFGVELLLMPLLPPLVGFWVGQVYWWGSLLILNALPEVLYQKSYGDIEAIKYAFEFEKRNLVTWYVPNALVLGLAFMTYNWLIARGMQLFSGLSFAVTSAAILVLVLLLTQLLMAYVMLYRGLLFNKLDTTSRQRRLIKIKH